MGETGETQIYRGDKYAKPGLDEYLGNYNLRSVCADVVAEMIIGHPITPDQTQAATQSDFYTLQAGGSRVLFQEVTVKIPFD